PVPGRVEVVAEDQQEDGAQEARVRDLRDAPQEGPDRASLDRLGRGSGRAEAAQRPRADERDGEEDRVTEGREEHGPARSLPQFAPFGSPDGTSRGGYGVPHPDRRAPGCAPVPLPGQALRDRVPPVERGPPSCQGWKTMLGRLLIGVVKGIIVG